VGVLVAVLVAVGAGDIIGVSDGVRVLVAVSVGVPDGNTVMVAKGVLVPCELPAGAVVAVGGVKFLGAVVGFGVVEGGLEALYVGEGRGVSKGGEAGA
jgi:hypothetical protein